MSEQPRFVIRPYVAEDKPFLIQIYREVWGDDKAARIAEVWDWKYHQHPFWKEAESSGLVLERGSDVLGFMGVIPTRVRAGGGWVEGHWGCDHMVSPKSRGIAGVALAKAVLKRFPNFFGNTGTGDDGGIGYRLWGLIGDRLTLSHVHLLRKRISIAESLRSIVHLPDVARFLDRLWWSALQLRVSALTNGSKSQVSIQRIYQFNDSHAELLQRLVNAGQKVFLRSVEYLNWRFFQRPGTEYIVFMASIGDVPVGYIVLRCLVQDGKQNGRIIDLMVDSGATQACQELLMVALRYFRDNDVRMAFVYACDNTFINSQLKRFGFSSVGRGKGVTPIVAQSPEPDIRSASRWEISYADSDFDMD